MCLLVIMMLLSLIRKNVKRYWRIARRKKNAKEQLNLYDRFCVAEILGGMNMSGPTSGPHSHISITSLRHRAVPCRKTTSSFIWQRKTGADRQDLFYQRRKNQGSQEDSNKWFETQDSISYWEDFSKPKIVWGEISDKSKFAFDFLGEYIPEANSFYMKGECIEYLLSALNSSVSEWLFSKVGTTTGVGKIRWKKYTIEQAYCCQAIY